MNVQDKIRQQVEENTIILYMKGTPQFPQCGFSGRAVQLLQSCGAKFASVNVLADPEIREGIKQFGNWPTVPQLYVKGQLVGGSDIMMEMHQKGELQKLIAEAQGAAAK
ncbi:MAG: Grx4 family monothiol glutaredoxin [Gammaproteobacteria bacterium]|nr:Grx4 family monothiol glutaredoxin [Gammaproteobacteria bacterium]